MYWAVKCTTIRLLEQNKSVQDDIRPFPSHCGPIHILSVYFRDWHTLLYYPITFLLQNVFHSYSYIINMLLKCYLNIYYCVYIYNIVVSWTPENVLPALTFNIQADLLLDFPIGIAEGVTTFISPCNGKQSELLRSDLDALLVILLGCSIQQFHSR